MKVDFEAMIERFKKEMTILGATDIVVSDRLVPDRLDSIWYNGDHVVSYKYKGEEFYVKGIGDISLLVFDENGKEIEYIRDKSNSGVDIESFENDEQMKKLDEQGRLEWRNNNWLEIIPNNSHMSHSDSDMIFGTIDELLDAQTVIEYTKWFIEGNDYDPDKFDIRFFLLNNEFKEYSEDWKTICGYMLDFLTTEGVNLPYEVESKEMLEELLNYVGDAYMGYQDTLDELLLAYNYLYKK